MDHELTLRIVLEHPPAGVDFGLQHGRGSGYSTVQTQRSTGGNLLFQFTVRPKLSAKAGQLGFTGPFVQGPASAQFVYIDIGTYAGQTDTLWSRRLKIPLGGITAECINAQEILETKVAGTGRDGGPSCATVKGVEWSKASAR